MHRKKNNTDLLSRIFARIASIAALAVFFPALFASAETQTLVSPTPGIASFEDFVLKILEIVVKIGIPVAVIFLVWSGFKFLTAQGNETELKKAKDSFVWAVIGTAVLLGAWALATAIKGTIDAIAR